MILLKKKTVSCLYAVLFFIIPLIYTNLTIDPVLIPRQFFLSIWLLIVGLSILWNKYETPKEALSFSWLKQIELICLILFVALIFISIFAATNKAEAYYVSCKAGLFFTFFCFTVHFLFTKRIDTSFLSKCILGFTIIFILFAFFDVSKILSVDSSLSITNIELIKSTCANKNLLSSLLFLTTPFLIENINAEKRLRTLSIFTMVGVAIIQILLETRAVWIAYAVFIITMLCFGGYSFYKQHLKKLILLTVGICLLVSIIFFTKNSFLLSDRIEHLLNENTLHTRLLLWRNSWHMIMEHPFMGVGAGNWQIWFPHYGLSGFNLETANGIATFQRPHNDLLWLWCEAGTPAMILYLSFIGIILFNAIKKLRTIEIPPQRLQFLTYIAAVAGYLVISFFDFPNERIEHQLLFYTLIAILFHKTRLDNKPISINSNFKKFIVPICFVLIGFSMIVSFFRLQGEYHCSRMLKARKQGLDNLVIRESNSSRNTFFSMDFFSIPISWYCGVAYFGSNDIINATDEFEMAYSVHPYNIHVLNNLASCYEKQNNHYKAELFYKKALSISPNFSESILNLSAVYFNEQKIEDAYLVISLMQPDLLNQQYKLFLLAILKNKIKKSIVTNKNDSSAVSFFKRVEQNDETLINTFIKAHSSKKDFFSYCHEHEYKL